MDAATRALAPARDQLRDTDVDGLPEFAHTIERFDRDCDFGQAPGVVAGFQDISDHALVTTDCRSDLRAHVIAGGLLPIHALEAAISRYKRVIGDILKSRDDARRVTEVAIAVKSLNRMRDLGQAICFRVA